MKPELICDIPDQWLAKEEAIPHIMRVMECDREKAEEYWEEFQKMCPEGFCTVWLQ